MTLYTQENIANIPIITQLLRLLRQYTNQAELDSNELYQKELSSDPVYKFLELCYDNGYLIHCDPENTEDKKGILDYLTAKYYNAKGTYTVIEHFLDDMNFVFNGDIVYTVSNIIIPIANLELGEEAYFSETLQDFLDALLLSANFGLGNNSIIITLDSILPYSVNVAVKAINPVYPTNFEDYVV